MINKDALINELNYLVNCASTLDQAANWVAVDILRHFGGQERQEIRDIINGEYPELAQEIQTHHPAHWK